MGVSSGGSMDFQNNTDKAEGGLMMLFFVLVFSVHPHPLKIFLPTLLVKIGFGCAAH